MGTAWSVLGPFLSIQPLVVCIGMTRALHRMSGQAICASSQGSVNADKTLGFSKDSTRRTFGTRFALALLATTWPNLVIIIIHVLLVFLLFRGKHWAHTGLQAQTGIEPLGRFSV